MLYDYHTHSTYSDGRFLWSMLRAAEEAGLAGIGFADHCNVSARERPQRTKHAMGFNLDVTYERRRDAIEYLRDRFDVAIFDAVEMDYDPRDVDEIESFLDEADFDYAIGSVHYLEDVNVHVRPYFAKKSDAECRALVEEYFDQVIGLVESELFDVAAHIDLVERNPELRGYVTDEQHHQVAEAFENSRTVPEINAGRVLEEYGEIHPAPDFMEVLLEHDVAFTVGSDSHEPTEVAPRKEEIEKFVAGHGIETVTIVE